ncbi:hypothetical protein GCM10027066_32400 [Dyella jejuensis]
MDVKKAMLECGYPNPYEIRTPTSLTTLNEIVLISRCMNTSGFSYKEQINFCVYHKELNACQMDGGVARDINKRRYGRFCLAHSSDPVCR